jgi:hypothetical protein
MAAAVPAAAAMDPATMSAIMSALAPILKGVFGNSGGPGSTYNTQQLDFMKKGLTNLNPAQGDITQNQGYQQGMDWLSNLFNDPNFFKSFEAPLMRQFEEETLPGVANRFAGMGSGGSTGSTAFRNQANRESTNLYEKLASLRGGLQQQGVNQSLQYAQQPVSNYLQQLQQFLQPTQNTYQQSSF